MLVTLDTSHLEMSPLKEDVVPLKIDAMLVTLDTFHSPIGPVEPLEQLPCGDSLRHATTAILSSALDCGENAAVEGMSVRAVCLDWGEETEGRD